MPALPPVYRPIEIPDVMPADIIERQRALISDMMTVMTNRLDKQDPKVKALLLRAIEEMPNIPE